MKTANRLLTAMFLFSLILILSGCGEINPFYAGGVVPGGNWLYYTMAQSIYKMRLDGTENQLVLDTGLSGVDYIHDIQLDPFRRKMYFWSSTYIYACNLDGTGMQNLYGYEPAYPQYMAFNPVDGLLYFIYSDTGTTQTLNPETREVTSFFYSAWGSNVSYAFDEIGNTYFLAGQAFLLKVDGPTSETNLYPSPTAVTASSRGLSYNRHNGTFYYIDGMSIQFIVKSSLSSGLIYNAPSNISRIVPYNTDNEIFYSFSGPPGVIRKVGMNGSNDILLHSDAAIAADSFDILSK